MSEKRKDDHIDKAMNSQVRDKKSKLIYEPMLSGHPKELDLSLKFMEHKFGAPIWFSSMTGGAHRAKSINTNLAKVSAKYKLGMGLGSCRSLLSCEDRLSDFDVKSHTPDSPLFTNLGIAQLERLILDRGLGKVLQLQKKLGADGLIIHVNPLQEWAQPEGDRYYNSPISSIKSLLESTDIPIVVKEVGQGIGPKSLLALSELKLAAIELAALGGTNFTLLEQSRHLDSNSGKKASIEHLAYIGHTKEEMVSYINGMDPQLMNCSEFIISGGIQSSLKGFEYCESLNFNSLIGLGSVLLNYAMDLTQLDEFVHQEIENLKLAKCFFGVANK